MTQSNKPSTSLDNQINSKKEELRNLEKKLNQENVQENKNRLILGLGLGIFGLGLVGLVVWLMIGKKK